MFEPDREPRPESAAARRKRWARRFRRTLCLACAGLLLYGGWRAYPLSMQRARVAGWRSSIRTPSAPPSARASMPFTGRPSRARLAALRARWMRITGRTGAIRTSSRSRRGHEPARHWMTVWATAYCPSCPVCETGRRTATGARAGEPGLAVAAAMRKRFVPLGSRLYIPRFGWLRVDDVGGGVRRNQIDIRVRTHAEAVRWGRRLTRVRLETRKPAGETPFPRISSAAPEAGPAPRWRHSTPGPLASASTGK